MNASITVRDLMTDQVYSVSQRDDLTTASDLMDSLGIRHLPVIDEEGLVVGLVSQTDLIRKGKFESAGELTREGEVPLDEPLRVEDAMTRGVVTVAPDEDITEAGQILLENKFSCLPVTEGDHLVGILTESDFVRFVVDATLEESDNSLLDSTGSRFGRDTVTGSSPHGRRGEATGGGILGAGVGSTEGTQTGEDEHSTARGGWGGTDDDRSTSRSDQG